MQNKRIEAVKNWSELKPIRDIEISIGFAYFYRPFIQNFNKIAGPLTSILNTSFTTQLAENLPLDWT